mmetsp:Transcript_48353/g.121025  ORF Transcript_48353/g.121025 Transcript_48353/m.121025 type:complete len:238 (+) Transcript_48353:1315-2028(+)
MSPHPPTMYVDGAERELTTVATHSVVASWPANDIYIPAHMRPPPLSRHVCRQTDGQTDRQTDRSMTHLSPSALLASLQAERVECTHSTRKRRKRRTPEFLQKTMHLLRLSLCVYLSAGNVWAVELEGIVGAGEHTEIDVPGGVGVLAHAALVIHAPPARQANLLVGILLINSLIRVVGRLFTSDHRSLGVVFLGAEGGHGGDVERHDTLGVPVSHPHRHIGRLIVDRGNHGMCGSAR